MTGANKCLFGGGKESCQKHRMYAYPGEKAKFCSNHKKAGMVDVHNKRCEAENCQKHPTYGLANGRARFCTKHKGANMVDVHCRPCEHPGCSKHPHYAFEGDKARFCASHKEMGMVDVKHKRCHTAGCREMRVYETPTKKSRFCMVHLDEWLSAKTTRRSAVMTQADNGPAKQRASANGSGVAGVGSNGARGRLRPSPASNIAVPPKLEYHANKREFDDKQDTRMVTSASLNAFLGSPSQEEDVLSAEGKFGRPPGVKRRVPKSVPMSPVSKARTPSSRPLASSSGGVPDRSGGVISAGPPAKNSPHGSVLGFNERLPKRSLSSPHGGRISVSLGMHVEDPRGGGEEMLLPSSESRGGSRGGCVGGVVGGGGVVNVGSRQQQQQQQQQQQAVLTSPPPLTAEELHSLAPTAAATAGGSAESAEPGGSAAPPYNRRPGGNIGGVDGAEGGGSGKRSRAMEAGDGSVGNGGRIGNGHAEHDDGSYSRGILGRSALTVYGQEHQQHQQADRAGGSRGVGGVKRSGDRGDGGGGEGFSSQQQQQQEQEQNHFQRGGGQEYSPKGDRFSSLSSGGIFPSPSVSSSACSPAGGVSEGGEGGRRRGRPEDVFDMPSRREAGGGGAMVGPSYSYSSEEGVAAAPLPPLSKDITTSAPAPPPKKGHRRHASFDPNTDCFAHHFSLGSGGISGPPGRSGIFPSISGGDGHGYTGPVAGLGSGGSFGSSFGGSVGGGSFGSSFGSVSNGRQHVRGCSSGSVDLNVLAPVLAELRNSGVGGGSIGSGGGAQQYPSLPPPRGNPHQDLPPQSHHAQQPTPLQPASQHHEERHEQQQQQQQQQRQQASYRSPAAAAAGGSHHSQSAGTLPVVAEPGTPPHILSDDAASAPSPKKAISQAHQHPNTHHGSHQHSNARHHSANDGGETELLHRHHQQNHRHHQQQQQAEQGLRGDAGGRHRQGECNEEEAFGHPSTARDYAAQFYGGDQRPGGEQQQLRQRQHLPTLSVPVSVSGSPRWSGAKTPSSSLYVETQGSASVDHLDSGRELHAGHVIGEGSTRFDGSRVDKGTIWIRHPEGMVHGGRRHFMPH